MKTRITKLTTSVHSRKPIRNDDINDCTYTIASCLGSIDSPDIYKWASKIHGKRIPKTAFVASMEETVNALAMDMEDEMEEAGLKLNLRNFKSFHSRDPLRMAIHQLDDVNLATLTLKELTAKLHAQLYWRSAGGTGSGIPGHKTIVRKMTFTQKELKDTLKGMGFKTKDM